MLTKKCEYCGREFTKPDNLSLPQWAKRRFHSRACAQAANRKPKETKVCEGCGEVFERQPNTGDANWAGRKYHNLDCARKRGKNYRGEKHWSWKGGRSLDPTGYVRVRMEDDHPFVEMRLAHGYVQEHRLVMAEHLGRPLRTNETVHHKNGVRDDNRVENLELWVGRHGRGAALCCADCGSRNIIPVT